MHLTFIPYGKREQVELLLRDMEAQKHQWVMTKGKKTKKIWLQGQVRFLPFGVYEYVFPKEDLDAVLNTLNCKIVSYDLKGIIFAFIKKMLKLKPIPKYSEKQKYLWIRDFVSIIPLGIREDREMTAESGEFKGWTHEAI
jgi:hypothetical protein